MVTVTGGDPRSCPLHVKSLDSARLAGTADADGLLGEAAHYGGDKSPSAAQRLGPLRELIDDRLLDALLERSRDEAGGLRLTGEGSMLGELVKAVLERALEAELTGHLGYARHDPSGHNSGNSRNGTISKKVQTGIGPVGIEVPRDRAGDFEPRLVPKRSGRISGGLDDMIISLYAHGMSVRDILHHLKQVYGTELSHETVSRITDAVLEEVRAWQVRPLDPVYAVVFLDAIMVKVRDNHVVQSKPAYLAAGIDTDGEKHVLGIWLAKTPLETATAGEGARFWASVTADLRNRGVGRHPHRLLRRPGRVRGRHLRRVPAHRRADLRGPPDPQQPAAGRPPRRRRGRRGAAHHLHRRRTPTPRSMPWPPSPPRRSARSIPRPSGSGRTPGTGSPRSWRSPRPCRKLLYTTNSIESLNYQLRKVTKARGHFPGDDAVVKLLWLAIINIEDKRARERAARRQETGKRADQPARLIEGQRVMGWREALNELDIAYPGRIR